MCAQVMNLSEAMLFECQRELPEVCAAYQKSYNLEYKYDEVRVRGGLGSGFLFYDLGHICCSFVMFNTAHEPIK